jgi:tripartite-type tricarboxylate transporter receptor subunit TctC
MNLPRRQFLHLAAGAAALPAVSRIATAQTYPSRPITMIVPFAPGAATDTIGRMMAERMKSSLGQPVIVARASNRAICSLASPRRPRIDDDDPAQPP